MSNDNNMNVIPGDTDPTIDPELERLKQENAALRQAYLTAMAERNTLMNTLVLVQELLVSKRGGAHG